jgi:hypothetical protein
MQQKKVLALLALKAIKKQLTFAIITIAYAASLGEFKR